MAVAAVEILLALVELAAKVALAVAVVAVVEVLRLAALAAMVAAARYLFGHGEIMNLQIPIETVNQILGYLGSRPYQEVVFLIQTIQNLAKEQMPPTAPEDTA